jgi:hypothetical protein
MIIDEFVRRCGQTFCKSLFAIMAEAEMQIARAVIFAP